MVSEAKRDGFRSEVKVKPLEEMSTLMDVDPFPRSRPLSFTSEFDSGNFLNVELIHTAQGSSPGQYLYTRIKCKASDYLKNINT